VEFGFPNSKFPSGISPAGPRNQMVIGPDPAHGELLYADAAAKVRPPAFEPPLDGCYMVVSRESIVRGGTNGYHHGSANVWCSHWFNWESAQAANYSARNVFNSCAETGCR
jgi:hypothetical protein